MNRNLIAIGLGAAMGVGAWAGCSAPPDTIGGLGTYPGGPTPTGTTTTSPTPSGTGTTTGNPPPGNPAPGTDAGTGTGTQTPQQYFETMVDPSLEPTCGGCHATGTDNAPVYLGSSPAAAYAQITAFPGLVTSPASSSPLLTKGAHEGPALTAAQVTLVTTWINMQNTASPPPPGSGITVTQGLTNFGNCMSLTDFTTKTNGYAVSDLANLNTANRGPCSSCHNRGTGGFWASSGSYEGTDETTVMFNMTQQFPYIEKFATAEVNTDGSFKDVVASNQIAAQQQAAAACDGTGDATCHPTFTLPQGRIDAINAFLTATQAHMTANQCTGGTTGIQDAGGGG